MSTENTTQKPKNSAPMKEPPLKDVMLSRYNRKADRLVLISAAVLSLVIVVLWGWSMWSQLALVHWKNSQENGLLKITADSWDQAFKNNGDDVATITSLKEKINSRLAEINALVASSTAATTTLQTVTTTATTSTAATTTKN